MSSNKVVNCYHESQQLVAVRTQFLSFGFRYENDMRPWMFEHCRCMAATHFFTGLTTASNCPTVASGSFKLFRWVLYKTELRLHELDSNTFYKIHFHNENRLIETESSSSGDSWLDSTHFSSGISTASNCPTVASDSFKLFRWVLSKNRNRQSKTCKAQSIDTTWTPFTKSISIMKKVGQPNSSANQPSIKVSYVYLRPPRWPPWRLPPMEPPRLNEPAFLCPVLTRVLLLILWVLLLGLPCNLPFPL